jgi:outer membrane protein assembly factor BamD (BamD/ComL family)
MNQKLTKRDIKQDKFVTSMLRAQEYFLENSTRLFGVIAAVVVVVVVALLLVSSGRKKEREAQEAFGRAAVEFRAGNFQLAAVDFQSVVDNFGGTDAARLASLYLADAYFQLENYDQAEKYYRLHLDKYAFDDLLTANATAGLAHCLRAKGSMKEAGEKFFEVYKRFPSSHLSKDCLFLAINSFAAAGDAKAAREAYDIFSRFPGESQRVLEAKQLMVEHGVLEPAPDSQD